MYSLEAIARVCNYIAEREIKTERQRDKEQADLLCTINWEIFT